MNIPEIKALIFMKYISERVSHKNIRSFCGRPLFHWILLSLNKSKYIKEIIINTDSEQIALEAHKKFAATIHMRPEHLLNITSNEANQIIEYDLTKSDGQYFIQTHCTNPLLTTKTIDKSIETYFIKKKLNFDSLFSVTAIKKRLYWENGTSINHNSQLLIKTQDLPVVFEENSCIYIFEKDVFFKDKNRIGKNPFLFQINSKESIDIDDEDDFFIAESAMSTIINRK